MLWLLLLLLIGESSAFELEPCEDYKDCVNCDAAPELLHCLWEFNYNLNYWTCRGQTPGLPGGTCEGCTPLDGVSQYCNLTGISHIQPGGLNELKCQDINEKPLYDPGLHPTISNTCAEDAQASGPLCWSYVTSYFCSVVCVACGQTGALPCQRYCNELSMYCGENAPKVQEHCQIECSESVCLPMVWASDDLPFPTETSASLSTDTTTSSEGSNEETAVTFENTSGSTFETTSTSSTYASETSSSDTSQNDGSESSESSDSEESSREPDTFIGSTVVSGSTSTLSSEEEDDTSDIGGSHSTLSSGDVVTSSETDGPTAFIILGAVLGAVFLVTIVALILYFVFKNRKTTSTTFSTSDDSTEEIQEDQPGETPSKSQPIDVNAPPTNISQSVYANIPKEASTTNSSTAHPTAVYANVPKAVHEPPPAVYANVPKATPSPVVYANIPKTE